MTLLIVKGRFVIIKRGIHVERNNSID